MSRESQWPLTGPVFVAAAALFMALAAPTVNVRDAGELTAAAFRLDVAHPTGFVADLLLFRFAMLVPVGDVAFRAACATALAMAAAVTLAANLVFLLTDGLARATRVGACVVTALVLATRPTVLRAATSPEVYALSLALALASLRLLLAATTEGRPIALRLASLLAGATLLLHTQARVPVFLALGGLFVARNAGRRLRAIARTAGFVFVGMFVGMIPIVYLPLAALRRGPIDWGDPRTPARFVAHVTAQRIRAAYGHRMFVSWRLPEDASRAFESLATEFGSVLGALAVIAVVAAFAKGRTRWLAVVACTDLAYAIVVNPMGLGDQQTLFLTIASACIAVGWVVAVALEWIVTRLPRGRAPARAAVGFAVLAAALARMDVGYAGRSDGWFVSETLGGGGALGALPVGAIVLCESDDLAGSALYARYVEGERPDTVVLPRQHLADAPTWRRFDAMARWLASHGPRTPGAGLQGDRLRWLVRDHPSRVRWEQGEVADERTTSVVLGPSESPVLAAIGTETSGADETAEAWLASRLTPGHAARRVAASVLVSVGRRLARGDLRRAVSPWLAAIRYDPAHAPAYTNLGVVLAARGEVRQAVELTREGLRYDPDRVTGWVNLARYLDALGDARGGAEARREAERRR